MQLPTSCYWLCLLCVLMTAISASCSRPKPAADRHKTSLSLISGSPLKAVAEYVQEVDTGYSFAIATITLGGETIPTRIHASFISSSLTVDGREHQAADLKGKLWVWHDDVKTVIEMPDRFTHEMAVEKILQILDELNQDAEDL